MKDYWERVDQAIDDQKYQEHLAMAYLFGVIDRNGVTEFEVVQAENFEKFKSEISFDTVVAFDWVFHRPNEERIRKQELLINLQKRWMEWEETSAVDRD